MLIVSICLGALTIIEIGILGAVIFRSQAGIFAIIMLSMITLTTIAGVIIYAIYRGLTGTDNN